MGLKELRAEIEEEVSTLLGSDFEIEVTKTQAVPHASDPAITFPDVTAKSQGAKLIETCVLYIDIRRSTELNFSHKPKTVAKLYTAFVRAMTRVARHHSGHVRGIIGDRVMVIFDSKNCFTNAVNCAIAMNTVSKYVVNKHFNANELSCGIGIDAGNMLATKTGIRRHGVEQANYRSLVWLGRPANIASKLTDLANKPAETKNETVVNVAYDTPPKNPLGGLLGLGSSPNYALDNSSSNPFGGLFLPANSPRPLAAWASTPNPPPSNPWVPLTAALGIPYEPPPPRDWEWREETLEQFLSKVEVTYAPSRLVHKDPNFGSFFLMERTKVVRARTPAILMTARVWKGFRSERPDDPSVRNGWFKRVQVTTPGLTEAVFGGDVVFTDLKD